VIWHKWVSESPAGWKGGVNPMKHSTIIVRADWDDDAKVWVATSDDIGLATEAETLEALRPKVIGMVIELLALEDEEYSDLPEIPVQIMAQQLARVPNPKFS
jgi:hypothetical protein